MNLTKEDIQNLDHVKRLNIINSISGIKPANLIGTRAKDGQTNVAIFSSVVHLGSNPALLGFIMRPTDDVPRHTYENIKQTSYYTINHVPVSIAEKAHYTSAKLDRAISEFDQCGLTEEYQNDFHAPHVKECSLKIGMKMVEEIPITLNDTILIIGQVEHLIIPDNVVNEKGYIDLSLCDTAGISGLNNYYSLKLEASFPYARPNEIPDFGS